MDKKLVGERLKKWIEVNYKSVSELTRILHKTRSYFNPYFAGESLPGAELLSILNKLGLDINWLLTGQTSVVVVKETNQTYSPTGNSTTNTATIGTKGEHMQVAGNINGKTINLVDSKGSAEIIEHYRAIIVEKNSIIEELKHKIKALEEKKTKTK